MDRCKHCQRCQACEYCKHCGKCDKCGLPAMPPASPFVSPYPTFPTTVPVPTWQPMQWPWDTWITCGDTAVTGTTTTLPGALVYSDSPVFAFNGDKVAS